MKQRKGLEEEALLILQPFHHFTYVTAHSPHYATLPSLHLCHSTFSSLCNPSVASSTSQHIIQYFRRFTYITAPTLLLLHLHHMHFTYVTWWATHRWDTHPPSQILDTPLHCLIIMSGNEEFSWHKWTRLGHASREQQCSVKAALSAEGGVTFCLYKWHMRSNHSYLLIWIPVMHKAWNSIIFLCNQPYDTIHNWPMTAWLHW